MSTLFKMALPNPPASQKLITHLEDILNVNLPDEYKALLTQNNGGYVYYNNYKRFIDNDNTQIQGIDYFESVSGIIEVWNNLKEYDFFMDKKIMPIAKSLSSTLIGLGISKDNRGKVFVFDWDFGATEQANDLIEFSKQIVYAEDGIDYPLKLD